MKTYRELLADYHEARDRAEQARRDWERYLPSEGVRLTTHPELHAAHEAILAAEAQAAAARAALIDYRGD